MRERERERKREREREREEVWEEEKGENQLEVKLSAGYLNVRKGGNNSKS